MIYSRYFEVWTWFGRAQFVASENEEELEMVEALTVGNPADDACRLGDEDPRPYSLTEHQLVGLPGGPEALAAWRAGDASHRAVVEERMVARDALISGL